MPGTPSTQSGGGPQRAPLMRRESSQTSHSSRNNVASPGSGEHPLRGHAVKPAARHKGVILPRNHSSARNLQKLNRPAQAHHHAAEEGRRRQRSHEGDTEIRLPGSLDESRPPPMRRNMTAYQLPRNTSHSKLKKNLSHGQLTRLGSTKNLAGLTAKGPPSPGLKARKKRPKSEDFSHMEKDLHEQEVELARQRHERKGSGGKKVGFAVGSDEGDSEGEGLTEQMEGSGLQEDDWTDQSASASPYSTRQNTANNSRRTSMILDKPPDKAHSPLKAVTNQKEREESTYTESGLATESRPGLQQGEVLEQNGASESKPANGVEDDEEDEDEDDEEDADKDSEDEDEDEEEDDPPSPRSMPQVMKRGEVPAETSPPVPESAKVMQRSPLHAAKDHPSPATQRILSRGPSHNPAPALVSNVSAMDVAHSTQPSPAPSMRSSRSNIGEGSVEQDSGELVSRFLPSASHPSTGSGGNTAMNTPKTSNFHTPENESVLSSQQLDGSRSRLHLGAISPGSYSGSSGAATPSTARSRTELRMMNDKAMADREDQARLNPVIPAHVFDRRNETLKWQNVEDGPAANTAPMTPDLFQGRFKAINTELKVVQRFRDPIAESMARLKHQQGARFAQLRGHKPASQAQQTPSAQMAINRSASQRAKGKQPQSSNLSTSASPPKYSTSPAKPALAGSKSTTQLPRKAEARRGRVTFSETPPEVGEAAERDAGMGADAVARAMWGALYASTEG
ncbi:uncharacterized protein LTR77_007558 [Saxophila tyrrhenica]|uniref:Uncharacterized protein n=1 Tax=Saxophila tyrrhenica TaxID=1690608 RepID=A0AAV9P2E9_9PEZI|nr:hypothetical protein LTR77_007558 [Saxophila tyrrhenica]